MKHTSQSVAILETHQRKSSGTLRISERNKSNFGPLIFIEVFFSVLRFVKKHGILQLTTDLQSMMLVIRIYLQTKDEKYSKQEKIIIDTHAIYHYRPLPSSKESYSSFGLDFCLQSQL